jgi:hypothetical protein
MLSPAELRHLTPQDSGASVRARTRAPFTAHGRTLTLLLLLGLTPLVAPVTAGASAGSAGESPGIAESASPAPDVIPRPARAGLVPRLFGMPRGGSATGATATREPRPLGASDCTPCNPMTGFEPSRFTDPTQIRDGWLPLLPGRQHVFRARSNADGSWTEHELSMTVTDLVKVVGGIPCVIVWIEDREEDVLTEAVLAFFAQDDEGRVWFAGEYAEEYELGEYVTSDGTWLHGIQQSRAGVQVLREPVLGMSHTLASAPRNDLLDCLSVYSVQENRVGEIPPFCVPTGCYQDVLKLEEWAPLEACPEVLHRVFGKGVGLIQVGAPTDLAGETLVLVESRQLKPTAMAKARDAAMALDAHGPEVNEVYSFTQPAFRPRENLRPGVSPWSVGVRRAYMGLGGEARLGSTSIRYGVPAEGLVDLGIFDVVGRRVRTLVRGIEGPGEREATWDGRDDTGNPVARGVYFARLKTATESLARTVVLAR